MRRWILALLLALSVIVPAAADPFRKTAPTAEATAAVSEASGGFTMWLAAEQHRLNEAISDAFHDVETGGSRRALALILALAFLYGALHALGPGHGKSIVASYFMAHHARWTSGILMGSAISLIQGLTAIVLVGLLAMLLGAKQVEVLSRGDLVAFISYGLIVAIGVWMFYRAAIGRLHAHDDHDHHRDHRDHAAHRHDGHDHGPRPAPLNRRLIVATGLTPCASAIIILLFALANDAFGLGVIAVAVLTIGMAATISTIGIATVLGRRALLAVLDKAGMETHRLERGMVMLAAVLIVAVSGLMMYDSWTRL